MKRPSYREINGKLGQARKLVSDGYIDIIEPDNIVADALELGYLIKDISSILPEILNEVSPPNYAGTRPPQRSYEGQIMDSELFAFRWKSKRFGCEVYLKFTIKDNTMWLVSFHKHREEQDE